MSIDGIVALFSDVANEFVLNGVLIESLAHLRKDGSVRFECFQTENEIKTF